jgi:hypothetical protein
MAKSKSKLMKCANIFAKLAAPASTRVQLGKLYSAAKKVDIDVKSTEDKSLINKSNALFRNVSNLISLVDSHGIKASFFAGKLKELSDLSSSMNNYVNNQISIHNPFITPVFGDKSNSLASFDVALSRVMPESMGTAQPKPKSQPRVKPSLDRSQTALDWPRHPSENEGLGPDGEILYAPRGRQDPETTYPSPYGPTARRIPQGQPVDVRQDVHQESVVRRSPLPPASGPMQGTYNDFMKAYNAEQRRNKRESEGQPQPGDNLLGGNLRPTIPGPDGQRIPAPK